MSSPMRSLLSFCIVSATWLPCELADVSGECMLQVGAVRPPKIAGNIAKTAEGKQSLIVCNAYAYKVPLDVFRARSQTQANMQGPIAYKKCQDVSVGLKEGDRLDFKAGDMDVGSFFIKGLPNRMSTLLLVPRRRSSETMAVSFQSHAFSELDTTQIAVVDAYNGIGADVVKIMDAPQKTPAWLQMASGTPRAKQEQRLETLRYNTIVALSAGEYRIGLGPTSMVDVAEVAKGNLSFRTMAVGARQKYVIMRVGGGEDDSRETSAGYPEELVVFPEPDGELAQPGVVMRFVESVMTAMR